MCPNCTSEFDHYPSVKRKFCSVSCQSKYNNKQGSVHTCITCHQTFTKSFQPPRTYNFCCEDCCITSKNEVVKQCSHCKEFFAIKPSQYNKRSKVNSSNRVYCSTSCSRTSEQRIKSIAIKAINRTPIPKIYIPDIELGYLGGCIDGEGTFVIAKNRNRMNPVLNVSNTKIEMPKWLQRITKIGRIYDDTYRKCEKHKTTYKWEVSTINHLRGLLPVIIPGLIIKRRQAEIMFEFCNRRAVGEPLNHIDYSLVNELKELNS